MNAPHDITMDDIAATMAETESMWMHVCNAVDPKRVDMLVQAMIEQHALVMEGESNANAIMSLVGFLAKQAIYMSEDGDLSIESAMVLLQIGLQRGVQAHLALKAKDGAT
jgi:hypothetical protein